MSDVHDDERGAGRRRGRRRGWSLWIGLGLVLGGLSILGWIGWQLHGTNVVSQRRHEQIVVELQREWAEAPGPARAEVETPHGLAVAVLRIPALGDDSAVPVLEGLEDDALASGIGHFATSAGPGEVGNYALAGHRVTHGEPLRDMPVLQPGDEVVVETRDMVYTYVLNTGGEQLRVPFTSGWVVDPQPVNPDGGVGPRAGEDRLITLTTCAELFNTDDRLVAFGHLQRTEAR